MHGKSAKDLFTLLFTYLHPATSLVQNWLIAADKAADTHVHRHACTYPQAHAHTHKCTHTNTVSKRIVFVCLPMLSLLYFLGLREAELLLPVRVEMSG